MIGGLEISLCGLCRDQLVRRQIRHHSPELIVLDLQLLEPFDLIALQPAIYSGTKSLMPSSLQPTTI